MHSLGTEEIKHIADRLNDETARAALHGALAYGGAVARGQSGGSAALGASASVLVNNLLGPVEDFSKEEKEARKNLVTSMVAGLADLGGADATSAQNAAQIETENNAVMVLAAPLAVTPPGLVFLGVVAAGLVAGNVYEWYKKDRANNAGQPGEEEDQLIQPPPPPMIKPPMEPQQLPQIPGRAWHQDEEVQLEGLPNQSGEHIVQPFVNPREIQSAGNMTVLPISEGLDILDMLIFSKGAKKANKDKNYVPNAGSVDKMEDFFNETELGRELKHISNPTKDLCKGAKLYKATDKIKGVIRKGEFFYIDKFHMNHLEVLDRTKEFSHVLNFDGTINEDKTKKAEGRTVGK